MLYQEQLPQAGDRIAWYLRVSTPRQKIEHQREAVERWLAMHDLTVPEHLRFEDVGGRRHRSDKREGFQSLLHLVDTGQVDWILIASFDRWGVEDTDEFFEFRRRLRSNYVKLYSCVDQYELTGIDDTVYYRVVSEAISATKSMSTHAERNIMKMVQMAEAGQHASGSVPYGLDLECRNLATREPMFQVHTLRRPTDGNSLYIVSYPDGREERLTHMPHRSGKESGYWLIPGRDPKRIEAVQAIFRLYAEGSSHSDIRGWLYGHGYTHYGSHFQDNCISAILDNPAYIGMPAWGKIAKGHYRQVKAKMPHKPRERKRDEPKHFYKPDDDRIYPRQPVFPQEAIIPLKLWERVKRKRDAHHSRRKDQPRARNRSQHSLNGKIYCGECGERMVIGRKKNRDGTIETGYWCGTYAKTGKHQCRYHWTRMSAVDDMMDAIMDKLGDAHDVFEKLQADLAMFDVEADLSQLDTLDMVRQWIDVPDGMSIPDAIRKAEAEWHDNKDEKRAKYLKRKAEIEKHIAEVSETMVMAGAGETVRQACIKKIQELEAEKESLDDGGMSPLQRVSSIVSQIERLQTELRQQGERYKADMMDWLIDKVVVRHDSMTMRNGSIRTKLIGFEVHFPVTMRDQFGESKFFADRMDRDWRRRSA